MKRTVITIVLLLFAVLCLRVVVNREKPFRVIPCPANEGFSIFSKDAKNGLPTSFLKIEAVKPYWTPGIEQVRKAEAGLPAYLISHPPHFKEDNMEGLDLSAGCRQYFGATRNGKKIIYINALHRSHGGCGNGLTQVLGGGFGYFQVFYNPVTNEYSGLSYNASR